MLSKQCIEEKSGIGKPITTGFVIILGLMIAMTAIALHFGAKANMRLHMVVENQNVKAHLAATIQTALEQRALSMHAVSIMTNSVEKAAERRRFDEYDAVYGRARDSLEQMPLTAEEKSILSNMRQLTKSARPDLEAVMELALSGQQEAMLNKLRASVMPKQRRIVEQADAFIRLQQIQADAALRTADATFGRVKKVMLTITLCMVSLGLLITYIVSRRVSNQGRQLTMQAMYDSLTNLPNRLMLVESLAQKIADTKCNDAAFAVVLMDLEDRKSVV